MTPDPIGIKGGLNLYAYASGNPINRFDYTGLSDSDCCQCKSGSYVATGVEYGGFLFFGGVTTKHLKFKCTDGDDSFTATIQCFNFGGGLGGGVQCPIMYLNGCNKDEALANATGWGIFVNVFPPGIPTEPGFGIGVDVGTGPTAGTNYYPYDYNLPGGGVSPGYGLEVSAGGSYCWVLN